MLLLFSHSVVSDSLRPHRLSSARLLSIGFPRPEEWRGLPFPSPGNLPIQGIEPVSSSALQVDSLGLRHQGSHGTPPNCWVSCWNPEKKWSGWGRGEEEEFGCIRSNRKGTKGPRSGEKDPLKWIEGKPRGSRLEPQDKRALSESERGVWEAVAICSLLPADTGWRSWHRLALLLGSASPPPPPALCKFRLLGDEITHILPACHRGESIFRRSWKPRGCFSKAGPVSGFRKRWQPAGLQPLGLCIRTATGLAKVADLSARIPKVSGSEAATRFGGPAVHRVTKTIWEMKWDRVVAPLSAPSPSCLL